MTLTNSTVLEKRLARIAQAKKQEAVALIRKRGIVDGNRADMVIVFKGRRYQATDDAIRNFEAAGIVIHFPQPLRRPAKLPFHSDATPPSAPALPRDELAPHPPAPKPENHELSERDKWVLSNTAPSLRASLSRSHTKAVGIDE